MDKHALQQEAAFLEAAAPVCTMNRALMLQSFHFVPKGYIPICQSDSFVCNLREMQARLIEYNPKLILENMWRLEDVFYQQEV